MFESRPGDVVLISHQLTREPMARALHAHTTCYEAMLFKSGNVDYFINDAAYHLEPGDVTLICPNDLHGLFIRDSSPYERIPLHIELAYAQQLSTPQTDLFAFYHDRATHRVCRLSAEGMRDFERHAQSIYRSLNERDFGWDVRLRADLTLILLLLRDAHLRDGALRASALPPLVNGAIQFISDHLTEELRVQTVADALYVSPSRLSHLFRQATGATLWGYVTSRRIQYARTLLERGAGVTEACYQCGFRDYANFIKVFTKLTNGISPGRYAKLRAQPIDE